MNCSKLGMHQSSPHFSFTISYSVPDILYTLSGTFTVSFIPVGSPQINSIPSSVSSNASKFLSAHKVPEGNPKSTALPEAFWGYSKVFSIESAHCSDVCFLLSPHPRNPQNTKYKITRGTRHAMKYFISLREVSSSSSSSS